MEADQPCDAVIAIGTVIRGETAHFDYVCKAASEGILRVGLDSGNPTIFCVLTDDTIEQSRARSGGEHGNKGVEQPLPACRCSTSNPTFTAANPWGQPVRTSSESARCA